MLCMPRAARTSPQPSSSATPLSEQHSSAGLDAAAQRRKKGRKCLFSQIPREARKTGREAPSRKTHLHLRTRHHRARLAARSPSRTGSWPFYCGALSSPRWFAMCYLAATQRAAGSRMAAALSPPILTAISRSRQTTRGVSHSLISQIYSNRLPTRHDSPHRQRPPPITIRVGSTEAARKRITGRRS